METRKEIAIYGKGGIGKSTVSANISVALALQNKRILQIGCDPKHDSTRLLTAGKRINTVLDYIKTTKVTDYKLEDILTNGYKNIGCIEAGGPEPGVGCAGRGIITSFELLNKFHIKENYDIVLYDVLGDVVCGGFAVPIRQEYANEIFLVTSGEYMAIYAANNILRGIKNYDQEKSRVAGIIYNSRNIKDEDKRVKAFSEAVSLPIVAKIPRADIFAQAEKNGITVMEMVENNKDKANEEAQEVYNIFSNIAEKIVNGIKLYPAKPLSDEDLENLIFYDKKINNVIVKRENNFENNIKNTYEQGFISKNVLKDEPLHGCAFSGATNVSVSLNDVAIIAHSPKSCVYLSYQSISSYGRRLNFERGALLPIPLAPNLSSTNMDESDMVFGGMDKLLNAVRKAQESKAKAVIIISSCPAGIIGDDIEKAKALSTLECPVFTIKVDGNLTGDYLQGMLTAYTELAKQIVDPSVKPVDNVVNIVFEKVVATNTLENFNFVKGLLEQLGVRINCRFLSDTSFESLKNFCSASLNLLAYKDYTGQILEKFFTDNYNCKFYEYQFPTGFEESKNWLLGLGKYFKQEEKALEIIKEQEKIYWERVEKIKPALKGKKLMIVTYNHYLDWILQAAIDVGIEIVKIGVLNFSQDLDFRCNLANKDELLVVENYNSNDLKADILKYKPDILLTNYESNRDRADCILDTIPMCPDNGFFTGIEMIERWDKLCNNLRKGEWVNDQELFNKYYSR